MRRMLLLLSWLAALPAASQPTTDRVQLTLDTSEAECVLGIVAKRDSGHAVADGDWSRLFATEPYVRLKKREASMHRDFTDEDFEAFVLSPELARKAPDLRRTLDEWKKADLRAAAMHVLPYLPAEARIRARVFPVVKPKANSFVFETTTDPAIFLYLDPTVSRPQFENTVAHECHHIGYSSIDKEREKDLEGLSPDVKRAVEWMGAFGEGFAVLAAAGGPGVHPHATSKPEDRARWDRDITNFDRDLKIQERFFLDVVAGMFETKDRIDSVGYSFFGVQGPWYTVGYKMAVTIEEQLGRPTLIDCMTDLRKLLPTYNRAAGRHNRAGGDPIAVWSNELVRKIEGSSR